MKRVLLAAVVCGSLFASSTGLMGCKDDRGNSGTTGGTAHTDPGNQPLAVVDLDSVAKQLGWFDKLQTSQEQYGTQLKADLINIAQGYDNAVKEYIQGQLTPEQRASKEPIKFTPTPEQAQALTNYVVSARQQFAQAQQKAQQALAEHRAVTLLRYKEALNPIVSQVARDKKFNVVFIKAENILYADTAVDLTTAVSDVARAKTPEVIPAPMPHFEGQPLQVSNVAAATQAASQPTTKPGK